MAITDIFIKRPVLSVVVSLLILLIGFRAATTMPIRQYPKLSNTVVKRHDRLSRCVGGSDSGLHHDADRAGGRLGGRGSTIWTSSSVLGTSTIQVYIKAELRSQPGV